MHCGKIFDERGVDEMSEQIKFNKQIKLAVIVFAIVEAIVIVAILIYHQRNS
jgi:hypothetical protein